MTQVAEIETQVVDTVGQYWGFVQEVAAIMGCDVHPIARATKLAGALSRVTAINGVQDPCWDALTRKVCSQEGYIQEILACEDYLCDGDWDGDDSILYGKVSFVFDVMVALLPPNLKVVKVRAR